MGIKNIMNQCVTEKDSTDIKKQRTVVEGSKE